MAGDGAGGVGGVGAGQLAAVLVMMKMRRYHGGGVDVVRGGESGDEVFYGSTNNPKRSNCRPTSIPSSAETTRVILALAFILMVWCNPLLPPSPFAPLPRRLLFGLGRMQIATQESNFLPGSGFLG
ncbi:hypothetical protein B0T10DRAFT_497046, partial [Thelonectria olida]